MANPSRLTKLGIAGSVRSTRNRGDYFKQIITAPITVVASTSVQTTTVQLPPQCVVTGAIVNVINAEVTGTTKTIDVGLSLGAGKELADGVSVADAGFVVGLGGVDGGQNFLTYTLGSADFVELDAEIVVEVIGSEGV